MENFLRKYKLIDEFTVELPIHKSDFVRRFQNAVDPGEIGFFSGAFEAWQSSNNDYKGEVTNQGFRIRRRNTFFQSNGNTQAIATGTFTESRDKLTVRTEVKANYEGMLPFYVVLTIFYLFMFGAFAVAGFTGSASFGLPAFALIFLFLHAIMMYFLPYYFMKKGVVNTRRNLEREFVFLANKS